jgi:CheY-like chemotaxis protein
LAAGVTVRALVVDDIGENREILSEMLRQIGCDVTSAACGREAQQRATEQRFDIVFLDIRMPDMDGMETLARLKADAEKSGLGGSLAPPACGAPGDSALASAMAGQRPRFVAVSASVLGHERDRCLAQGFDAFLGKPFLAAEVSELLERLLGVRWEAADRGPVEGGALTVPTELFDRLKSSARGYRVTELKEGLAELEGVGGSAAALAARLRRLARVSRMAEVLALLEEAQEAHRAGPASDPGLDQAAQEPGETPRPDATRP